MSVVAEKPLHGLRLVLTRDGDGYSGTARTTNDTWDVRVAVAAEVSIDTAASKEVADWIRRVVRIAVRDAESNGTRPPRQIHRWRAERE
ncbi:MAG TPA: hypothetical protein VGH28_20735 [Polyangiaceae bacterium]|jgi:hypothetical protein